MGTTILLGNTIHLNNTTGTPVAGGAASGATTTPFVLQSDTWSPRAATRRPIWAGGAPFRDGADLLLETFDNVAETVPIVVQGSSRDDAVAQLQTLKELLQQGGYSYPLSLAILPHSTTNTGYAEIYTGDVEEDPRVLGSERTSSLIRATITWIRSPFFGVSSLTTLINAATFTNNGTGANKDTQSLGALTGDLIYTGMPLNIKVLGVVGSTISTLYAASVDTQVYASVNQAKTTTTSTTYTTQTVTLGSAVKRGLRGRVLGRLTTFTNLSKAQFKVDVIDINGSTSIYTSAWLAAANATASLIDFGDFDLSFFRRPLPTSIQAQIVITIRSSDGTSVTATLDYVEVLLYYDFCVVNSGFDVPSTTKYLYLEGATNNGVSPSGWLPSSPPVAYMARTSDNQTFDPRLIRGRLPRAFSGASLYLAWIDQSGLHDKTTTATITAQLAPLYRTLRGST